MGYSAADYLKLLQRLLPQGFAWSREPESGITRTLEGFADEFARVDGRVGNLITERDTRSAVELLGDHETDLGIPDECSELAATISERQAYANNKLVSLGGQTPQYFIDMAERVLGITITITEFTPFWAGYAVAGAPVGQQEILFYWQVTSPATTDPVYFAAGNSTAGDALVEFPVNTILECLFGKYKPAHTEVLFEYIGPEFGCGFGSGFNSRYFAGAGVQCGETSDYLEGAFNCGFGEGFGVKYGGAFCSREFGIGFDRACSV